MIFLAVMVAVFGPLNVIAYWALSRTHPRRRAVFIALTVVGNAMWLFFPLLNARTDFTRAIRATLGPLWFAWQCFTFLYAAFLAIVFLAWLAMRRVTFRELARQPSRIFLSLLAIGGAAGFYQCLVPLRIERVPVAIESLPPELEGTRLALIADLHVGLFTRPSRLREIFTAAGSLRPDAVFVLGDSIDDDPYYVPKLLAGARTLDRSIPLIGVLGNHEMYGAPEEAIAKMRGGPIRLLVNEGIALKKRLWIAGLSDYAARLPQLKPNLRAALANRPAGALPIVIAHQPRAFADARAGHIALTLCGHSHGGQLGIRPLHWSLAGVFIPYHMGLYRRGASQLYVNTGTGYWVLPFRLGMTPEITLIELHGAR